MADTFKGIVTVDGKKRQLPYESVFGKPIADRTLTIEGAFADAKVVGDKFKEAKAETGSLKEGLGGLNDDYNGIFTSKNMISNSDKTDGYYNANGFTQSTTMQTSNLCVLEAGQTYTLSNNGTGHMRLAFFDTKTTPQENKAPVEYITTNDFTQKTIYTFVANHKYVYISCPKDNTIKDIMLELGSTKSEYVPYEKMIKEDLLPDFSFYKPNFNIFKNAYIKNGALIANNTATAETGNNSAQYTVAELKGNVRKIMAKVKFHGDASIAIISNPNGMNGVTSVTNKSIHCVFSRDHATIGYFNNKTLTNTNTIEYNSISENVEVLCGFIVKSNSIVVYTPNGENMEITNENYSHVNGKFALFEHYINLTDKEFASVEIVKVYADSAYPPSIGEILCDDFQRMDGAVGVAPTGQVWGQFSNHEQAGWDI